MDQSESASLGKETGEVTSLVVDPDAAGVRLDRYLAERLDQPRNRVQRWIREHGVQVDAEFAKASHTLTGGETVTVRLPEPVAEGALRPEPGSLELLYQDDHLLVLDKPADLVVHPGAGRDRGTLCHRLVAHDPQLAQVGHPQRPGIVHRLDRGTSGVMVVARTDLAYQELVSQFSQRRVDKLYLALCFGILKGPTKISAPIGRHPTVRVKMAVRRSGRAAQSDLWCLALAPEVPASAVAVRLYTGRTHQIRVHLSHLGHPLLGDSTYGGARVRGLRRAAHRHAIEALERPALHAYGLGIDHPVSGERLVFTAPLAGDLVSLWRSLSGRSLPLPPFPP